MSPAMMALAQYPGFDPRQLAPVNDPAAMGLQNDFNQQGFGAANDMPASPMYTDQDVAGVQNAYDPQAALYNYQGGLGPQAAAQMAAQPPQGAGPGLDPLGRPDLNLSLEALQAGDAPGPAGPEDYGYEGGAQGTGQAGLQAALMGGRMLPWGAPVPADILKRAEDIRASYGPGPRMQEYMDALTSRPPEAKGFMGHLKGALKGLAMGNIGGAILGAIDPGMTTRAWHRLQAQAYEDPAKVEQLMRQERDRRIGGIAERTGIDPETGFETPMAGYRRQAQRSTEELRRMQAGNYRSLEESRQSAALKGAAAERRLSFNAEVGKLFQPGANATREQLQAMRVKYPEFTIPDVDPTKYSMQINMDGSFTLIPISGPQVGTAKPVLSPEGKPIKSYEVEKEKGRAKRQQMALQATKENQAAQQAHSDAQKEVEQANKAVEEAERIRVFMPGAAKKKAEAKDRLKKAEENLEKTRATAAQKDAVRTGSLRGLDDPLVGTSTWKYDASGNVVTGVIAGIDENGDYIINWNVPGARKAKPRSKSASTRKAVPAPVAPPVAIP